MSLGFGITAKEYAEKSNKPLNTVSGRFTELARDGWIERTSERRDGAAVWRATI
jgi:DNA-binding IclR family transcriptional regulator